MTMEHAVRLIAGSFILISLAIGYFLTPWALLFTAFVGFNLSQSALTRWRLMEDILAKFGLKKCHDDESASDGRAS